MSVTLRKRKNADGTTSLYLDLYHGGKRQYEFLKECQQVKPATALDRQRNREKLQLAEQIALNRGLELQGSDYNLAPSHKKKADFLAYLQGYIDHYNKRDKRVVISAQLHFTAFLKKEGYSTLTAKEVTESLVYRFKRYLEDHLNGESPSTYFSRFKKVLKQGCRDKLFTTNPAADITIKRKESIKKEVLTINELRVLAKTPIGNEEVKRAFLFCCYTGLRWVDVRNLRWQNIDLKTKHLAFTQSKTSQRVDLELHPVALSLLGAAYCDEEPVFTLPSHTAAAKNLKRWVKQAGIRKHITWHCARHTFATNLLLLKADVTVVSKLLGHSSLRYTQLYTRVLERMTQEAIHSLPAL